MKRKNKETKKELGIIGLGKMGGNLAMQLANKKWKVIGYDEKMDKNTHTKFKSKFKVAKSVRDLVEELSLPRTVWLMTPHAVVDEVLEELLPILTVGDTVIDGGNSPFKETVQRAKMLEGKKINFLDAGVSGGPGGALNGACVMVGGSAKLFKKHEQLFKDISLSGGYLHVGNAGAGHFVKMVHNGIEYGMMQAIGEGSEILKKSEYTLDVKRIANLYNHGSVITSSLVGWLIDGYKKFGENLENCSGEVSHSGEGQWTVETAKEMKIPVPIISGSLEFRKKSKGNPSYTGQVVSAMRNSFGGHSVKL
jgi:6-phosphogluconate dehydrogenase